MPLVSLSPEPILRFVGDDNLPLVGGKLYTYQSGTNNPVATYTDYTGSVQHANPIILNSRGEVAYSTGQSAGLWMPSDTTYTLVLKDANDNQIWPINGVSTGVNALLASITSDFIADTLDSLKLTQAEQQASVTPVDPSYPPGDIRRYGATAGTGNDSSPALQAAVNVAAALSVTGVEVFIPQGTFTLRSTILFGSSAVSIRGSGKLSSFLQATGFTLDQEIFSLTGDTADRINALSFKDFALGSDNNLPCGIDASFLINSNLERLYFYKLNRGFNASDTCFSNNVLGCSSFLVTEDCFTFGVDDCNNWTFTGTRFVGKNGVNVTAFAHALVFDGCDMEGGTSATGAMVRLAPAAGKIVHSVDVIGCYFESNIGYAVACEGADLNSVKALTVKGNYITGTPATAVEAIKLFNAVGFDISENYFQDFTTAAFLLNGTERNGKVWNNTAASCPALETGSTWHSSVDRQNNFLGRGVSWVSTTPVGVLSGTVGDLAYNLVPGNVGWACTATGTPGTWLPFGSLYLENTIPYDPASLADGDGFTTTVTVTGAALGDLVSISFSLDLQGIIVTGYVSSANTVSVRFQNETGGTINLGAGNLKARVIKQ